MSRYLWSLKNYRLRQLWLTAIGMLFAGILIAITKGAPPDSPLPPVPTVEVPVGDALSPQSADEIQVEQAGAIPFVRVHVPSGRLADVSAAGERYIPMAAAEFEEAVRQLAVTADGDLQGIPKPAANQVTFRTRLDEAGRLSGTIEFSVATSGFLPVGKASLENCRWRPADDQNAEPSVIDLFGLPDGSVELRLPGSGVVTADVTAMPDRASRLPAQAALLMADESEYSFELPLVPALATSLELDLPTGLVPRVAGNQPSITAPNPDLAQERRQQWQFLFGPRKTVKLLLAKPVHNRMTVWSSVRIGRRATRIETVMRPETTWKDRTIRLTVVDKLMVTSGGVQMSGNSQILAVEQGATKSGDQFVQLPLAALGTDWPLRIEGLVAGAGVAESTIELPGLSVSPKCWAGGGMQVEIAPDLQCAQVEQGGWLPVSLVEAKSWPLWVAASDRSSVSGGTAKLSFEQQKSNGHVRLTTAARRPEYDIARVTTVDVTATTLVGRAACDIQVRRGRVHQLEAKIAPEWLIDSVEPLVSPEGRPLSANAAGDEIVDQQGVLDQRGDQLDTRYEWNVVRRAGGDWLILDLPTAITPDRELRLRITGHRRGVPAGGRFQSTAADMVQLEGESMGQVWIDFHTSPETTLVESEESVPPPPFSTRLTRLAEDGAWRQRVPGGRMATPHEFLFLRRRPPLDVETRTRLTVRGDKLNETFTFTCQPQQGELDAVTVHFSEPVGDLDWSVLKAGKTTVFARRFGPVEQPTQRAAGVVKWPAAESWLIELTPPVPGVSTIRATGSRLFKGPLAVPLAWVEAAIAPRGEILVQAVGRQRPQVRNNRLIELPPQDRSIGGPLETVSELSYDIETALVGTEPAVEIAPLPAGAQPVPRGWVWQEKTTVRCFASAAAEYETNFSIENDGRKSVLLTVPGTHRLLGISINDERLPLPAARVGNLPVFLPEGQRQIRLTVRSASVGTSQFGVWRLPTEAPSIDAPTLTRQWHMLLPSSVQIASTPGGFSEVSRPAIDWIDRLLGGRERDQIVRPTAPTRLIDRPLVERQFVPVAGRHRKESFVLVDRTSLATLAVLLALVTAIFGAMVSWQRSWLLVAVVVFASVMALWVPEPVDFLARAVLWGGLGITVIRLGYMMPTGKGRLEKVAALLLCLMVSPVAAEQPLQVFLTPVEGETTALVPEPLFRVLAATETDSGRNAIRILDCRVEMLPRGAEGGVSGQEIWWLNLLVETDAATALPISQAPTESRFAGLPVRVDGGVVRANRSADQQQIIVSLPAPGLHMLAIPINPVRMRRGDLEVTTVRLPVSPQTTLVWSDREQAETGEQKGRWTQCEWAPTGGRFRLAGELQTEENGTQVYQLPAAEQIRLIRPVDPQARLTSIAREAESSNEITWTNDGCQLTARFLIESGNAILPTVWLQADPRLIPAISEVSEPSLATPVDYDISKVADGVFRIDQRTPVKGPLRLEIPFTMPLATAIGIFDLPDVWLRSVQVDHREVVLKGGENCEITVRFPGTVSPPQIEEQTLGETTVRWSSDIVEMTSIEPFSDKSIAITPNGTTGTMQWLAAIQRQPVRIEVARRNGVIRGRQQMQVIAGRYGTELVYEATLDARFAVWTDDRIRLPRGFVLENLQVFRRNGSEEGGETVDTFTRVEAPRVQRLMLQQPAAGQYLLRVIARSDRPLPITGRLPLIRSATAELLPLTVIWNDRAARGRPELLNPLVGDAQPERVLESIVPQRKEIPVDQRWRIELPNSRDDQRFRIRPLAAEVVAPVDQPPVITSREKLLTAAMVELVDIEMVVDERGRISGVGRFDLSTTASNVRMRLPEGFRLFELLLDGRQVQPRVPNQKTPADIWTIPVRGGPWPHELLLVFVGELGEELFRGEPVSFALPEILDLPVERKLLTIKSSKSQVLRIGVVAKSLSDQEAVQIREEASVAVDRAITAMLPATAKDTRERIARFREQRLRQLTSSPLESWAGRGASSSTLQTAKKRFTSPFDSGRWHHSVFQLPQGDSDVTVRFADTKTAAPGRVSVTLLILIAGGASWLTLSRRPARMLLAAARWWPIVMAVVAVVWLITRQPSWPGGLLACLAGVTLIRRLFLFRWVSATPAAKPDPIAEATRLAEASALSSRPAVDDLFSSTVSHRPVK